MYVLTISLLLAFREGTDEQSDGVVNPGSVTCCFTTTDAVELCVRENEVVDFKVGEGAIVGFQGEGEYVSPAGDIELVLDGDFEWCYHRVKVIKFYNHSAGDDVISTTDVDERGR